jgi:hypothetical protein
MPGSARSTIPARANAVTVAAAGTRQDFTSTRCDARSSRANHAARLSEVTSQLLRIPAPRASHADGSHTGTVPAARARAISVRLRAARKRGSSAHSMTPNCSIASTAMSCAAASENCQRACAARTVSAKQPPPGTITVLPAP